MKIGIYKIENPNKRIYIGQSIDIDKRKNQYDKITINIKNQPKLYRSLKKYGPENHKFEIIEECKIEDLNIRERYWQEYYNVLEEGLNCKLTKTKDKSGKLSQEIKNKISKANKYKPKSEKFKNKLRKAHTGKKKSIETRKKMSRSKLGIKYSKNTILKRSNSNKKKILQYSLDGNFIKEWKSATDFFEFNNKKNTDLSKALKGIYKQSHGFQWRYYEPNYKLKIKSII